MPCALKSLPNPTILARALGMLVAGLLPPWRQMGKVGLRGGLRGDRCLSAPYKGDSFISKFPICSIPYSMMTTPDMKKKVHAKVS